MRLAAVVGVVCVLCAADCGGASGDGAFTDVPAPSHASAAAVQPDGPLWFLGGTSPGSVFSRPAALYHVAASGGDLTRVGLPRRLWSITGMAVSPNGRLVALSNGGGEFPPRNLYVMHADGTALRQITRGNFYEIDPAWSPDGRWIVFSSTRCCATATSSGHYALYAIHADGRGLHLLRHDRAADDTAPAWSPDGTHIAYVRTPDQAQGSGIWAMNADGSGTHPLTHDHRYDTAVAWSPTGRRLAYTSNLLDDRDWQVRVIGADGGDPHAVFTCRQPCGTGGYTIAWSPDGHQLAFTLIFHPYTPKWRPRLAVVNAVGGGYHTVPTHGIGACCLSWIPRPSP